MTERGLRPPAAPEPRQGRRGPAGVARDVVLLGRSRAAETRTALADELRALWSHLEPLAGGVSPEERTEIRTSFHSYCDAAAHRRVRRRQIVVIAHALVAALAGVPTVMLIAWTFDSTRPVALFAYLVTAALLAGAAGWAVRGRRLLTAAMVAASAGTVVWLLWPRPPVAQWWHPRTVLALPVTDRERVLAGIAIGAGLTLVLIGVVLASVVALALAERSRSGGGSRDVRAFDHFLAVVELVVDSRPVPGSDRRRHIQEALRTAKVALLVMARGGRPVGWAARWHGRKHYREYRAIVDRIAEEIRRANPLTGKHTADEQFLPIVVPCMIGICRDQLGEALRTLEEAAAAPEPSAPGRRVRPSAATLRKLGQLGVTALPLAILLGLKHFGVPMPGVGWLFGVGVVILVIGSFVVLMPGLNPFLDGLGKVLSAISAVLPSRDPAEPPADEPPADEPAEDEPAGDGSDPAPRQRANAEDADPAGRS